MNIGREEDSREDQQSNNWTDVCGFFFLRKNKIFFFLKIPLKAGVARGTLSGKTTMM